MSSSSQTYDIQHFLPELVKMEEIQEVLKTELGVSEAERIINEILEGVPYDQIKGDFEDIISDYVDNHGVEGGEGMQGYGSDGEFPITIMSFGPLYWIYANEFDDIKYFKSEEDAISYAEIEYEPYFEREEDYYDEEDEDEDYDADKE